MDGERLGDRRLASSANDMLPQSDMCSRLAKRVPSVAQLRSGGLGKHVGGTIPRQSVLQPGSATAAPMGVNVPDLRVQADEVSVSMVKLDPSCAENPRNPWLQVDAR